ncbi:MAG: DUF2232 domain-containing protein, partial [Hyphomicrobium sp.]
VGVQSFGDDAPSPRPSPQGEREDFSQPLGDTAQALIALTASAGQQTTMTTNQLLMAIAAGVIAAVVFASATTGAVLLRFVLFFLTPLSLYLAGLGLGPVAAGIAAIVATLTILALTNPVAAIVFAISAGLPAVVTTRLALLGRQDDSGATVEWYPIGRIVFAAALFGGLFAGLALSLMGGDMDAMAKTMRSLVENFVKNEMPQVPGAEALTAPQIDEIATRALGLLPWSLAALSVITTLLNLWLAGRITLASGRLTRPWPDLSQITLPASATFALLFAIAAAFMSGMPGLIAGGFAGAFTFAFALLGLALAHALTRGSPWRNFILSLLYATFIFYTPVALLLLALAGLAETIFHYRARGPSGPSANDT